MAFVARFAMKLVRLSLAAGAVGGASAAQTAAQEPVLPHETFTLRSAAVGEVRRINVWTPPGYAAGRTRYPVLYMPDGGVEEDFPHVVATVDSAVRAGQMRPVIVVGIENTERRRDMTGPTEVASDRAIAPRVGGSAAFRALHRRGADARGAPPLPGDARDGRSSASRWPGCSSWRPSSSSQACSTPTSP